MALIDAGMDTTSSVNSTPRGSPPPPLPGMEIINRCQSPETSDMRFTDSATSTPNRANDEAVPGTDTPGTAGDDSDSSKLKPKTAPGRKSTQNLKFIESYVSRMLTFNERRKTLFKKVYETAVTTGAECLLLVKYHRKSGTLCQYWGTSDILEQFETEGVHKKDDYVRSTDYDVIEANPDGYNKEIQTAAVTKSEQKLQFNIPMSLIQQIAALGNHGSAALTCRSISGSPVNVNVLCRDNGYSLTLQSEEGALLENLDTHYACSLTETGHNTEQPPLVMGSPDTVPILATVQAATAQTPLITWPQDVPSPAFLPPSVLPPASQHLSAQTLLPGFYPAAPIQPAAPVPAQLFVGMCARCKGVHTGHEGDGQLGPQGEFVCAACLNITPPQPLLQPIREACVDTSQPGTNITGRVIATPVKNKNNKKTTSRVNMEPSGQGPNAVVVHAAATEPSEAEKKKKREEALQAFELDSEDEERIKKDLVEESIELKDEFYVCMLCSKSFGRKSKAMTHVRLRHDAHLRSKVEAERLRAYETHESAADRTHGNGRVLTSKSPKKPEDVDDSSILQLASTYDLPTQQSSVTASQPAGFQAGVNDAFVALPREKQDQILLLGHAFTEHREASGREVYRCLLCPTQVHHKTDIYKHTFSAHGINSAVIKKHNTWRCPICNKSMKTSKKHRIAHMKTHKVAGASGAQIPVAIAPGISKIAIPRLPSSTTSPGGKYVKANKDGNRRQCHMCEEWFHQCYISFHRQYTCQKAPHYGTVLWTCNAANCRFQSKVSLEIVRHREMHKKERALAKKKAQMVDSKLQNKAMIVIAPTDPAPAGDTAEAEHAGAASVKHEPGDEPVQPQPIVDSVTNLTAADSAGTQDAGMTPAAIEPVPAADRGPAAVSADVDMPEERPTLTPVFYRVGSHTEQSGSETSTYSDRDDDAVKIHSPRR